MPSMLSRMFSTRKNSPKPQPQNSTQKRRVGSRLLSRLMGRRSPPRVVGIELPKLSTEPIITPDIQIQEKYRFLNNSFIEIGEEISKLRKDNNELRMLIMQKRKALNTANKSKIPEINAIRKKLISDINVLDTSLQLKRAEALSKTKTHLEVLNDRTKIEQEYKPFYDELKRKAAQQRQARRQAAETRRQETATRGQATETRGRQSSSVADPDNTRQSRRLYGMTEQIQELSSAHQAELKRLKEIMKDDLSVDDTSVDDDWSKKELEKELEKELKKGSRTYVSDKDNKFLRSELGLKEEHIDRLGGTRKRHKHKKHKKKH